MKCYKPKEICDFLRKAEKERTIEEKERYVPTCLGNIKLLGREFGGFVAVPLRIPESIHIFLSPMGCIRHCQADIIYSELEDRLYRLPIQEKEIVLGQADQVLCEELDELLGNMKEEERPKVVTVTGTCIDGLLHTDFHKTRNMLKEKYGCRMGEMPMLAFMAESKKNHGDILMEGLYSLVSKMERSDRVINIIGRSTKAEHHTDFYKVLEEQGYQIQQLHECTTLEAYDRLGCACLNVVVSKHSICAAEMMKKKLGIPYILFFECILPDEMAENYQKLEQALGIKLNYEPYYEQAKAKLEDMKKVCEGKCWAVGGNLDYQPMKFMCDFVKAGFEVKYLFGRGLDKKDLQYYEWFEENTPNLDIYPLADLETDEFFFHPDEADLAIGVESYRLFTARHMKVVEGFSEEPYDFVTFVEFMDELQQKVMTEQNGWAGQMREPTMFDRKWNQWGLKRQEEKMSRLFHRVPSFAPDYSGACSVLHDMGGMIVYCDSGACCGNTMAFDEPRRAISKRIFSLALREKEIVVGMDKEAKKKIVAAHKLVGGSFIALMGAPVSTVIGTDFEGLAKEVEKEAKVPVFGVTTSGLYAYDCGQEKAYEVIFQQSYRMQKNQTADVHILGATPIDAWDLNQKALFSEFLGTCGFTKPLFWGDADTFACAGNVGESRLNIAVSVSAVPMVKALYEKYGTPYKIGFPVGRQALEEWKAALKQEAIEQKKEKKQAPVKRALIIGEQIASNMLRDMLRTEYDFEQVDVMTFWNFCEEFAEEGDAGRLLESEFCDRLREREPYDMLIGDPMLTRAVPYKVEKVVAIPNLALSGMMFNDQSPILFGECGSKYFEMEFAKEEQ